MSHARQNGWIKLCHREAWPYRQWTTGTCPRQCHPIYRLTWTVLPVALWSMVLSPIVEEIEVRTLWHVLGLEFNLLRSCMRPNKTIKMYYFLGSGMDSNNMGSFSSASEYLGGSGPLSHLSESVNSLDPLNAMEKSLNEQVGNELKNKTHNLEVLAIFLIPFIQQYRVYSRISIF